MQLITAENFFLLMMGFVFFGLILMGPVLLVMHFLMPKVVLEKYFKPPYFRPMEVELFTGIPYAPMRTIMLMWGLAFPRFGKKRGMTQAYLLVPRWYRLASGMTCISAVISLLGVLGIGAGFYIYYEILGYS